MQLSRRFGSLGWVMMSLLRIYILSSGNIFYPNQLELVERTDIKGLETAQS